MGLSLNYVMGLLWRMENELEYELREGYVMENG